MGVYIIMKEDDGWVSPLSRPDKPYQLTGRKTPTYYIFIVMKKDDG